MNKYKNGIRSSGIMPARAGWMPALQMLFLGLTVSLATTAPTHAASKDKLDQAAEAKQVALEEAAQAADREKGVKGMYQRTFIGTFVGLSDTSQKVSPEVVGMFVTSATDKKPGRNYLVKVDNTNKTLLETLKRFDQKKAQVTGKLQVIGPDGEGKYLLATQIVEQTPTPPAVSNRKLGGI